MTEMKKAKAGSDSAQRELDKAEEQFKAFDENVQSLTLDRMNEAPKVESEMQTKMSTRELEKANGTYLKPKRSIMGRDKFNESFRKDWEFSKEYVNFVAENKEIIGETIDMWTKPFGGVAAEWWEIPTNKPVWAPRYVAEQLKRCIYHRLKMEDRPTNSEGGNVYYGAMAVDTTVQRLDAHPVAARKSLFMGGGF